MEITRMPLEKWCRVLLQSLFEMTWALGHLLQDQLPQACGPWAKKVVSWRVLASGV